MSDLLARVRVGAGQLALLGALALVAALLVTAVPKAANDISDRALRRDIAALPYSGRDLIFRTPALPRPGNPADPAAMLAAMHRQLPPGLQGLIGAEWFTASAGPEGVATTTPAGVSHLLGLRVQSGAQEAARLTAGRWPATTPQATHVEIAVSTEVADRMGVALDTVLIVHGSLPAPVSVVVVGLFEAVNRSAPIWDDAGQVLTPAPGIPDVVPPSAIALTDPQGLNMAAEGLGGFTNTWRFRVDERRLDAGMIDAVAGDVDRVQHTLGSAGSASTGLDVALQEFKEQTAAARALLAVAGGGLVCTLLGLIGLAARLAVQRRREEFALVRARGGSVLAISGRALAESALVLPAVVVAGWLLGRLAPGRPPGTGWLLAVVGALAVLAVPVLAVAGQHRLAFSRQRTDLLSWRPSARRLTAELSVLGLAVLGTYLLRRRGLSQGGVDPFLVCVPVLLAAAAALLTMRIAPWPLRQASQLTARARGAMAFIGLARAGRGGPAIAGPLAVLVVAITTGVFCSVITTTVDDARDRAAVRAIPGDALLTGYQFGPQTAQRLAAVPGVTAVAPVVEYPSVLVRSNGAARQFAHVLVVDVAAFRRVTERSGLATQLPPPLVSARQGSDGAVPAVVSADVAADPGDRGRVETNDGALDFTVAGVADSFPGLDAQVARFIIVPSQALPETPSGPPLPNRFLVAGRDFNVDTLRQVGDAGQRALPGSETGSLPQPTEVTLRVDRREAMESTGANQLLTFAFVVGTAGGVVLALLAVGFTVLAEAGSRGRALSRLRTMGLANRQGRRLLAYELVPLLGVAVLAGAAVGVLLPRLLGPSLGLRAFTAGESARTDLDPLLVGGLLGLVVFAVLVAIGFESLVNRRRRLGEVLRLGEEN